MNCKHCGAELKENARFCGTCGTAVAQEAPAEENAVAQEIPAEEKAIPQEIPAEENAVAQEAPAEEKPEPFAPPVVPAKKKSGAKKIVAAAVALVLVVALVAALFNWGALANSFRKITMSEQDYLSYVHTHASSSFTQGIAKTLTALPKDQSATVDLSLALGDGGKQLLSLMGVELDTLPSASIGGTVTQKIENDSLKLGCDMALKLSKENLFTLTMVLDEEENAVTLRIPELNDKALKIPLPEMEEEELEELSQMLANLSQILPDEASLQELTNKYLALIFAQFKDVESKDGSLKVDNVEQNCSVYTAVFDGESLQKAAETILEALKNDRDVKKILRNVCAIEEAELDFDELWEEYQDGIDFALETVKDDPVPADALCLNYTAYVDGVGNLIGCEAAVEDAFTFKCVSAVDGKAIAQEISFTQSGSAATVSIEGNGTLLSGKLDAEYTLQAMGMELFTVTLDGFDTASAADGRLNGTSTLKFGKALAAAMTEEGADLPFNPLTDLSLQIKWNSPNKNQASQELSILYKDSVFATVASSVKTQGAAALPSFDQVVNINDSEALAQWAQEATENLPTPESIFKKLGLSDELADELASLLEGNAFEDDSFADNENGLQEWEGSIDDWESVEDWESFDDWNSGDDWDTVPGWESADANVSYGGWEF